MWTLLYYRIMLTVAENREEESGMKELSSGDEKSKSEDGGSTRKQSKRKAEKKAEASEGESNGSDGKRTKRRKRSQA